MKPFSMLLVIIFFTASAACAEDKMVSVFDKIDDLLIRVDSGISLNSFAESYAEMKIEYKKALTDPERVDNLLLSDRMKNIMANLDDYSKAWKGYEVEGYKYMPQSAAMIPRYPVEICKIASKTYETVYEIACVKKVIYDEMKPKVEKAKSAHFNGW